MGVFYIECVYLRGGGVVELGLGQNLRHCICLRSLLFVICCRHCLRWLVLHLFCLEYVAGF